MKKGIIFAMLFTSMALTATQNFVEKTEEAKWKIAKVLLEKFGSARIGNSLLKSLRIPPILAAITASIAWFITKKKVAVMLISAGTFVSALVIGAPIQWVHDDIYRMAAFLKSEELASSPEIIKRFAAIFEKLIRINGYRGAGFFFREMLHDIKTAIKRYEAGLDV